MSKPKPMPSYWALAEEVTHLHGQLDQLKAENARLKQELEAVGTAAYLYGRTDIADENAKLRDENAELRKLGGFMLRCISQYHDCADCLVNGEHCEISYIEADALELGIEVD